MSFSQRMTRLDRVDQMKGNLPFLASVNLADALDRDARATSKLFDDVLAPVPAVSDDQFWDDILKCETDA